MFSFPTKFTAPILTGLFCVISLSLPHGLTFEAQAEELSNHLPGLETTTTRSIRMLPDSEYFDSLVAHIREARNRIDMAMFVFKSNKKQNNRPSLVIHELAEAVKRGVTVKIILERSGRDDNLNEQNEFTAKILRKNGAKVLFDSPKTTQHAKVVVIDAFYCFVGSHNMTHSALKYNKELSLMINDADLAGRLIDYINTIGE